MITLGLPYRVVGGLRFYERAEIRDAIAYMRVLHQSSDDLAFERIVNVPRRGVGEVALRAMHVAAREQQIPLALASERLVQTGGLKGRVGTALKELFQSFARWREELQRDGHVLTLAKMLDESGYTEMWKQDKSPDAPGRLENLKDLVRALADFETLAGFLDHVSLVMENEQNAEGDRASMMTLHGAKGLEFDTVFLPGWEEGLFPSQRTLDEGGLKGLEEERRLAYVGLTRARKLAVVSYAANRRIYANWQSSIPSRFVDELPDAHVERGGSAAMQRGDEDGLGGQRVHQRPVDGPASHGAARRRGMGAAGPSGARGCDYVGQPGVPPEVRLWRGAGRGRRPLGDRVREGRAETAAGPVRGKGMRRHAVPLETVFVEVPDAAVEAYEAALGTVCATVGFFFADEERGIWRVEGVHDAGADEARLQDALALAALVSGAAAPLRREATEAEGWLARTREAFPQQLVGRRFAVRGTHQIGGAAPGRLMLTLDAGLAFGSGEHGSTRGCLRALEVEARRRAEAGARPRYRVRHPGDGGGDAATASGAGDGYRTVVGARG